MSVTLGIYDFFAYIIPGLLYLYVLNEFLRSVGAIFIDFSTWFQPGQTPSIIFVIPLLIIAYVFGHIFDLFAYQFYVEFIYRLRHKRSIPDKHLQYLKEKYPSLDIRFEPKDWNIMFTFLRGRNVEMTRTIDKYQVDSIMLRNIAFGSLVLSIVHFSMFFSTGLLKWLIFALVTFIFSLLAVNRSNRFRTWFYGAIFQASLEYGKNLKEVAEYTIKKDQPQRRKIEKK
jgi:hypothetical protein